MPNGLPGFPQSRFPGEEPPTLFNPSSPKRTSKPAREADNASMRSTSTFASTISLLKENAKSKLHSSHHKSNSEKRQSSKRLADVANGNDKTGTLPLPRPEKEVDKSKALKDFILMRPALSGAEESADSSVAKQATAEAYRLYATTR